jgi:hypothetical protein
MRTRFKLIQPVRFYRIEVDLEASRRHLDIMLDFIQRGMNGPRQESSGPVPGKRGFYWMNFSIPEKYADEYEQRMRSRKKSAS